MSERQGIKGYYLKNMGGFDIKGRITWWVNNVEHNTTLVPPGNYAPIGHGFWVDCAKLSVEPEAAIILDIIVLWGKDRTAGPLFTYDPNSEYYGYVTISGTTTESHVSPVGLITGTAKDLNDFQP